MKKLKIFVLLLTSLLLVACGDGKTSKKCFEFDKFSETITKYDSKCGGKIRIPDTIDDVQIKNIGDFAFYGIEITELELPKYLEKISDNAFPNVKMKELYLNEKIKYIGKNAFGNGEIESLKVPISIESIGDFAFDSLKMKKLEFYDKGENNSSLYSSDGISLGSQAFANNELESIKFLTQISSSGDFGGAFKNNKIKEIIFSDSQNKIPYRFLENNQIEKIILPEGIEYIDGGAFKNNKIKELTLPNSLKIIWGGAFANNEIEKITFGSSIQEIKKNAFANNKISNFTIPSTIRELGEGAFTENQITEMEIPNTILDFEKVFDENVKITKNDIIPEITGTYSVYNMANNHSVKIMAERRGVKDISLPEAINRCDNLELGGFSGWRIPTPMDILAVGDHLVANSDSEIHLEGPYWNMGIYEEFIFSFKKGLSIIFSSSDGKFNYGGLYTLEKDRSIYVADENYSGLTYDSSHYGPKNSICVRDIK